jgi:hypothetical protein
LLSRSFERAELTVLLGLTAYRTFTLDSDVYRGPLS